jgi:hypothetical protein
VTTRWQNRRFNRVETVSEHIYITDYGYLPIGEHQHSGFIKSKLTHGHGYSVIVPDILFLGDGSRWLQPLAFGPNIIEKFEDDDIRCRFNVDVSCGNRLIVSFTKHDFVQHLMDGSELYRCRFQGPENLGDFITGDSVFEVGAPPLITLYHHTKPETKEKILASGEFWTSPWNIQGTRRKLTNVGYVYFTALDRVKFDADLTTIAMASDGYIDMLVDGFQPPQDMPKRELLRRYSNVSLLHLQVYRGSTLDRTATLEYLVDCSCLAPQHTWRHDSPDGVWYEICNPFTHRVGLPPERTLPLSGSEIRIGSFPQKHFDYVIVGDATTVAGLSAPYDEEETSHIWKIERVPEQSTMLDFWMEHGNTDHFSGKSPEMQQFRNS